MTPTSRSRSARTRTSVAPWDLSRRPVPRHCRPPWWTCPPFRQAPRRRTRSASTGLGPVRWLSPSQLLTTAIEVLQGTIFARFADKREVMGGVPGPVFKLNEGDDDVWFDYVADTGDGFSATYATACSVMRGPNVERAKTCDCLDSPRSLVVLGGDEVYPTASNTAYEDRLDHPFREAFVRSPLSVSDPQGTVTPVMALPGNHDWYDGLAAFRRNFCESWVTAGYDVRPWRRGGGAGAHRACRPGAAADQRDSTSAAGARSSPAATSRCSCRAVVAVGPGQPARQAPSTPSSWLLPRRPAAARRRRRSSCARRRPAGSRPSTGPARRTARSTRSRGSSTACRTPSARSGSC